MCINVSRVLVYRHECPGHEKLSTGLERRPATQAPVSGRVSAIPGCAENSNHSKDSRPERLVCTAEGNWLNDNTHCVCDIGYSRDGDKCEGSIATRNSWHQTYYYIDLTIVLLYTIPTPI